MAASSASTSMPSLCSGTPTSFAPTERKEFSAPTKLGASQSTTSPGLIRALASSSSACWAPEVISSSSKSRPAPCFSFIYVFRRLRKGA